jgi:general secretion pathway protein C
MGGAVAPAMSQEVRAEEQPSQPDSGSPSSVEPEDPITAPPSPSKKRRGRHASSHRPSRDQFSSELERGVKKVGERRYVINRGALDLALGNLGLLSSWVRVGTEVREGKPFGFRLFAIKADGPIAKLGLRDGDVLVSVNGLDITTPDRVLDAFGKLKAARRLVLGMVRGGREVRYEYTIR